MTAGGAASALPAQGATTGALDPKTGRVYLPVGRAPATNFGGRAISRVRGVGRRAALNGLSRACGRRRLERPGGSAS